jgi:hypothetical protein
MRKYILKLSVLILLSSCVASIKTIELKRRNYDDAPLNENISREIGDKLVMKGEEDYQEAIKITECPNFKLNGSSFIYRIGDIIPLSETKNNWNLYYNKKYVSNQGVTSTNNSYIPSEYQGIAIDKKDKNLIVAFFYSFARGGITTKKVENLKIEPAIFVDNCKNCFKQEFIFNGKSANSLKFIYREYINDMARPAFNQDLQYDFNESKIIGFKGLRIEIINVTNTNIEYKILSSFTSR